MKPITKRILVWTPRVLCLLFAAFLSIFALDVFDQHLGFWKTCAALLIHMIPTWLVLGLLFISWRREWIGAVLFNLLAAAYIVMAWGRFSLGTYAIISGPLFVVGILFLLNWLNRTQLRPQRA
jgi:hypothetical protein